MPRRLLLALLLLVATPMVLLGWMSANAVKTNQAESRQRLKELLSVQLDDADHRIVELFEEYAVLLEREIDVDSSSIPEIPQTLRRMRREVPIVRQGIIVDPRGAVLFPTPEDSVGIDAAMVAASIPGMIDARPLRQSDNHDAQSDDLSDDQSLNPNSNSIPAKGQTFPPIRRISQRPSPLLNAALPSESTSASKKSFSKSPPDPATDSSRLSDSAWQQWYMADGAQVVYWSYRQDGFAVGILLERSRWMADLIAVLPDDTSQLGMSIKSFSRKGIEESKTQQSSRGGSVVLVDESKRIIYRWGNPFDFQKAPLAVADLTPPLASWQLRLHVDEALLPSYSPIPMYVSLGGIALVLLAVGGYVLTSVQRQIADAKSRVNFAGQVSHELRTPLTNIRLYTELAESDINKLETTQTHAPALMDPLRKRLLVIDHESRRLQRLVSGVLEMIRPSGKPVGIRRESVDLCVLIAGIADQFTPSFDAAGLKIHHECQVDHCVSIDPDIIEMVLVNLISNVEKYVPRGGTCWIHCECEQAVPKEQQQIRILISDDGPGIASRHRSKIFRPFERIDDSISAPSGTGIGLTIARRAAQRHGGNLDLLSKPIHGGATFVLTIPLG